MSDAQIHLQKTLCAMRWIALLTGKTDVAHALAKDQQSTKGKT